MQVYFFLFWLLRFNILTLLFAITVYTVQLQTVKDNLKTLLKYHGNVLDQDLHIQSYTNPTPYLADQNGFSSLIASPRTTSLSK